MKNWQCALLAVCLLECAYQINALRPTGFRGVGEFTIGFAIVALCGWFYSNFRKDK